MSRLTQNILYNLVGQFLRVILAFVSVHYVFKKLGGDALGIIYLSLTLNLILVAVLDMGLSTTTVREVSTHIGQDPAYIRDLIRTGSSFYWGAYLLLVVVIYFGARLIVENWIRLETLDSSTAVLAMQILGISALMALPRTFYASIFRGLQRMEFNNLIDVATTSLQQLGIILILLWGGTLLTVIGWIAASFFLAIFCYLAALSRFFPLKTLMPGFSSDVLKRNLHFSSWMVWISILAMVHMQADKLIMGKLLPISLLGYYGFIYSVCCRATLLTSSVSQAAFPAYAALLGGDDKRLLFARYRKVEQLVYFGTIPIFAAIPFASPPLLSFVFNPEVASLLLVPVAILSLGFYLNGTLNVPFGFSLALGKPEITARFYFWALILILPLTTVLIYFWGLIGASLAWVVYHVFGYLYAIPRICSQCLNLPVRRWYGRVLRVFSLAGLTYGVAGIISCFTGRSSVIFLGTTYLLASAGFLFAAYFTMGEELRTTLDRFFHDKVKGIIFKAA